MRDVGDLCTLSLLISMDIILRSLTAEEAALKEEKAQAIKDLKEMIAKFSITKGDLRGATMNILNGKKRKK